MPSYKIVTRVLQGCYKSVSRVLQGCCDGVISVYRLLTTCQRKAGSREDEREPKGRFKNLKVFVNGCAYLEHVVVGANLQLARRHEVVVEPERGGRVER
jgi:hypothetical protein